MNSFQKDMKRIQKLVGSAYNKTGSLLALSDGGQMSRKKAGLPGTNKNSRCTSRPFS